MATILRFPHGFVRYWPVCRLSVVTPRLTLRFPDMADMAAVAEAAEVGVYDPASAPNPMGDWAAEPDPHVRAVGTLTNLWGHLGTWEPDRWHLTLVVIPAGEDHPVGVQAMSGTEFGVCRTVETGSWLRQDRHGEGIGTEMRAAVLHLAFAGLGAVRARSGAHEDNPASIGVSRRLGYEPDGTLIANRDGRPVTELRFALTSGRWEQARRDDIQIEGLGGETLSMFGVGR